MSPVIKSLVGWMFVILFFAGPARKLGGASRDAQASTNYWAFHPLTRPTVPAVKHKGWPRAGLDNFILARLEEKGLAPAPLADKATLLRRATFDLHGLPPTIA